MPKRILLADDSITIQKVVELTFSDGDYEVTAVNNGAKAIQKLSEMRPDIILSDIIMPEKNGYEVCEYVKSHPDFRHLPVILLTGTFEPFDPDRADKAGCDAVVTKPFESQSLIQKVEELIEQSRSAAAAAPAPSVAAPPQPFATAAFPPSNPPAASAGFQPHGSEIFAAPATQTPPPAPMPFAAPPAAPAFGGETGAFPPSVERSPWDEPAAHEGKSASSTGSGSMASSSPSPASPEPSPWDEPVSGGETRAFGKMSFDDLQKMAGERASDFASPPPQPPPPPSSPAAEPSPWDAPDAGGGETRAMPRMSFDEMRKLAEESAPAAAPKPEASPWDQPEAADAGATRAFPPMNFADASPKVPGTTTSPSESSGSMWGAPEQSASPSDPMPFGGGQSPEASPTAEPSPWDAPHEDFSGETTALPKMSFDEMSRMAQPERANEPEPAPSWTEQPPSAPSWPSSASSQSSQSEFGSQSSSMAGAARGDDGGSFGKTGSEEKPAPAETSSWMPNESEAPASTPPSSGAAPGGDLGGHLTDEQIDRIARRVVELMADTAVRNIAWEVIPDLAERVVKERIRQLESE